MSGPVIEIDDLPPRIITNSAENLFSLEGSLREGASGEQILKEALTRNRGNRDQTESELSIHRTTLSRKMKRLGIA